MQKNTESSEDDTLSKEIIMSAVTQGYNRGYDAACEHITQALKLIPVNTMAVEDVFKVIDIVKRVSKDKQ